MGDTLKDVSGCLRRLAVELVRTNRSADAAAVLVGIGAVEMLPMFGEEPAEAVQKAPIGPSLNSSLSPGY